MHRVPYCIDRNGMDRQQLHIVRILALDLLVMILCASNIPSVANRARFPVLAKQEVTRTVVIEAGDEPAATMLQTGDLLLEWNDRPIGRPEHLEFLADLSRIGETVQVTIERDAKVLTVPVTLISYTPSLRFALVYAVTGFVVISIALFLFLKRPADPLAHALHDGLIGLGALILLTQGSIDPTETMSYLHRAGLFAAYALTPALFFRWTLMFPVRRFRRTRWPLRGVFAGAASFIALLTMFHLTAMGSGSAQTFDSFQTIYEWFHLYFAVTVAAALTLLVAGYVQEENPDRRAALQWILWGALVGALPFTILVVLPQAFGPRYFLAEELALLCVLALPFGLTVAFLRYHVFHVQVTVYRRLASIVVASMTGAVAILASLVLVSVIWEDTVFNLHFDLALAVAAAMVLFQPLRTTIRKVLEESLYPTRGRLGRVLQQAVDRFRTAMSPDHLGASLVEVLHQTIPGVQWNFVREKAFGTEIPPAFRTTMRRHEIVSVESNKGNGRDEDLRPVRDWLRRRNSDLALGLHDEAGSFLAVILGRIGPRRSVLTPDEAEALLGIVSSASESLARLFLQEQIFLEQQERRRSDELNRQKSHFVSSVSHDLRTPLTSISMFAEMMQNKQLASGRREEYARIIHREADRLGRMVNNVLNFARIERGTREYSLRETDLRDVVRTSSRIIEAHARSLKARIHVSLPRRPLHIRGDADALQDVVLNLLGNALKYSRPPRKILVDVSSRGEWAVVRVRDNGIGIPSSEIDKIMDPFYRVKDPRAGQTGGAGLGLTLVKHTVEAHGGTVIVESRPDKGTTVTVSLPTVRNSRSAIRNRS